MQCVGCQSLNVSIAFAEHCKEAGLRLQFCQSYNRLGIQWGEKAKVGIKRRHACDICAGKHSWEAHMSSQITVLMCYRTGVVVGCCALQLAWDIGMLYYEGMVALHVNVKAMLQCHCNRLTSDCPLVCPSGLLHPLRPAV